MNGERTLPAGDGPSWENNYPGRLKWELDALRSKGVSPTIDPDAFHAGYLVLTFDWELSDGTLLSLKAEFPDSFPHLRPQVYLLSGLAQLPEKHINPLSGNLCLLGRESAQWQPSWTLEALLSNQLEDALTGTGPEDPQGEPAEFWWNSLGPLGAYCLIDSYWQNYGQLTHGRLVINLTPQPHQPTAKRNARQIPLVQGYVSKILGPDGAHLHSWSGAVPPHLSQPSIVLNTPWIRVCRNMLPLESWGPDLDNLRKEHDWLKHSQPRKIAANLTIDLFAVLYPSEIQYGKEALSWLFAYSFGKPQAFLPKSKKQKRRTPSVRRTVLPTLRAGSNDISFRSPNSRTFQGNHVALIGLGAIGGLVAIELARNLVTFIHLIDKDVVEPGNTIRWPLGAGAWGKPKVDAIAEFIGAEYPDCQVSSDLHAIGDTGEPGDTSILNRAFEEANLVIDCSASNGVTSILADECRRRGLAFISAFATPTLEGGAVSSHLPDGGCPICLEYWWKQPAHVSPHGWASEPELPQPPGCSERTFSGESYDLQEISLQVLRAAHALLSGDLPMTSCVYTLSYCSGEKSSPRAPSWRFDKFPVDPRCHCQGAIEDTE